MKAKDKETLGTIRMLTAAIKQIEVDERRELSDADILSIVAKMIKQRKDAAEQFAQANREDLQQQELVKQIQHMDIHLEILQELHLEMELLQLPQVQDYH